MCEYIYISYIYVNIGLCMEVSIIFAHILIRGTLALSVRMMAGMMAGCWQEFQGDGQDAAQRQDDTQDEAKREACP